MNKEICKVCGGSGLTVYPAISGNQAICKCCSGTGSIFTEDVVELEPTPVAEEQAVEDVVETVPEVPTVE